MLRTSLLKLTRHGRFPCHFVRAFFLAVKPPDSRCDSQWAWAIVVWHHHNHKHNSNNNSNSNCDNNTTKPYLVVHLQLQVATKQLYIYMYRWVATHEGWRYNMSDYHSTWWFTPIRKDRLVHPSWFTGHGHGSRTPDELGWTKPLLVTPVRGHFLPGLAPTKSRMILQVDCIVRWDLSLWMMFLCSMSILISL